MKKNLFLTLILSVFSTMCFAQNASTIIEQMKKYSDAVYQKQHIYYTIDEKGKVVDVLTSQTLPESVRKDMIQFFKGLPAFIGTPGTRMTYIFPTEENVRKAQEQPQGVKMKDGTTISMTPVGAFSADKEPTIGQMPKKGKTNNTIQSEENRIYDIVEQMPMYPGGINALIEFLSTNIKYPLYSEENGVEGRILINFVVEKDGSISSIKTVSGNDYYLEIEAERVVKIMPNWIPGRTNKGAVRVKYTLPVTFRLQ